MKKVIRKAVCICFAMLLLFGSIRVTSAGNQLKNVDIVFIISTDSEMAENNDSDDDTYMWREDMDYFISHGIGTVLSGTDINYELVTYKHLEASENNDYEYPDLTISDFVGNASSIRNKIYGIELDSDERSKRTYGLDAIQLAIESGLSGDESDETHAFRENSSRYFILIGYDDLYSYDEGYDVDEDDLIDEMNDNDITLYSYYKNGDEDQYIELAEGTGGQAIENSGVDEWYENDDDWPDYIYDKYGDDLPTYFDKDDFSESLMCDFFMEYFDDLNSKPELTVETPINNSSYGVEDQIIPKIEVSDDNGDTLECSYNIDEESGKRETKEVSNTEDSQEVAFSALPISSLSDGEHVIHFYVEDYQDEVTEDVTIQVDKTPPTITDADCEVTSDSVTISLATDEENLSTLPYRYVQSGVDSGWTTLSNYTIGGLTPNTAYTVEAQVKDAAGNVASEDISYCTNAQVPTVGEVAARNTTQSFTMEVDDDNPTNTQYQVKCDDQYLDQSGNLVSSEEWITLDGKEVVFDDLPENTTYDVKVKAKNQEDVETSWSNELEMTTLAPTPTGISYTSSQTSITIDFNAVNRIQYYELLIDGNRTVQTTNNTYVDNGLGVDTTHTYQIRIVNAGGAGAYSSEEEVSTLPYPPSTPGDLTAQASQTQISLSWNSVVGADSYVLLADGNTIEVEGTSYVQTGLETETTHTYQVKAVNRGGESDYTDLVTTETLPYPPDTIETLEAEKTNTSITLSFEPVDRAVSYQLEIDGVITDIGTATTYTHEGLGALTSHKYRVRGVNAGGNGNWSDQLIVQTNPDKPAMPSSVFGTSTKDSISLFYNKVDYAETYDIEIDGDDIIENTLTALNIEDLGADETHSYRVRACNVTGKSDWSDTFTISTLENSDDNIVLTNIGAVVSNHSITISWEALDYDATYAIEVDGKKIDLGQDKTYLHSNLESETLHQYKIIATKDGEDPVYCGALSLYTLQDPPDAIEGLTATSDTDYIQLQWEKSENANTYDLEIDGTVLNVGDTDSYLDENLDSGTQHTYRVRALNVSGTTSWSDPLVISTTSPEYIIEGQAGDIIDVSVVAKNVQDFSTQEYVIEYDDSMLSLVDISLFTPDQETGSTTIDEAGLTVKKRGDSLILTIDKAIVPGTSFDGEIDSIRFKLLQDGETSINLEAQQIDTDSEDEGEE